MRMYGSYAQKYTRYLPAVVYGSYTMAVVTSLVYRHHFPEHEDDCVEAYLLRAGTWTRGHSM